MKNRNLKKVILFLFTLINLSISSNASTFYEIENSNKSLKRINNWTKIIHNIKKPTYKKKVFNSDIKNKNSYSQNIKKQFNDFPKNDKLALENFGSTKDQLEIESEIQSEENNILYASGNVVVSFKGNTLRADSLIYNKLTKEISAKGNVVFLIGEQILNAQNIDYDLVNEKGNLSNVKGLISTDNLIDDLFSNFSSSDIKTVDTLKKIQKKKVINTPNEVINWIFYTDQIIIDQDTWKAKEAFFTNDLLELKQVKIVINSLKVQIDKEQLRFKSSLNYLILDENLSIPFWFGDRVLSKSDEGLAFQNKWNIGFDNIDKDGYFIGRRLNPIYFFDDFVVELEPQLFLQRSLKGHTHSFVQKGESITSSKVRRDISFSDYFGLDSKMKGRIANWDFEINKTLSSFDPNKISDAARIKGQLSKEITLLNSNWDNSFYAIYRDLVWNGSIGEAEIYGAYGWQIEKEEEWEVNSNKKSEYISFGIGNIKGEELNSKNLTSSFKGSIYYELIQKFPLFDQTSYDKSIDKSFKYNFEPTKKGISLNTKVSGLFNIYEIEKTQQYIGFGLGPELVFGDYKNDLFDYTRFSIIPFYKVKSGDSIFKFDQILDVFTLDLELDQQIFGPIILKTSATLNLDSNSEDYGDFINSKISLNWKKRSYEFGLYYQPQNESGGIMFNLFGFK